MEEKSQLTGVNGEYVAEVPRKQRRWPTVGDIPAEAKRATICDLFTNKKGSFVYFLVDGHECVYVGKASSLKGKNWTKWSGTGFGICNRDSIASSIETSLHAAVNAAVHQSRTKKEGHRSCV